MRDAYDWTDGIHFGAVGEPLLDSRLLRDEDDPDPDDEALAETPPYLIAMLGFDPKDLPDEPSDP